MSNVNVRCVSSLEDFLKILEELGVDTSVATKIYTDNMDYSKIDATPAITEETEPVVEFDENGWSESLPMEACDILLDTDFVRFNAHHEGCLWASVKKVAPSVFFAFQFRQSVKHAKPNPEVDNMNYYFINADTKEVHNIGHFDSWDDAYNYAEEEWPGDAGNVVAPYELRRLLGLIEDFEDRRGCPSQTAH